MSTGTVLRMDKVARLRGGRLLFEGLDITLAEGEALLVTGANGVGKSSLIRLAAGLLRPSAGSIARSGKVALADEGLALDPRQTLRASLSFWARLDDADLSKGMETMGLSLLGAMPVRILSTGQRKRAVLARLIASGAQLWLLDEPANGLDREGQDRLAAAMAAHRAAGGAILAASHVPIGLDGAATMTLA